ncbi:MAG: MFS transporter, partial [Sphingomonas sp.]
TSPVDVQPKPAASTSPARNGPKAFAVLNAEWLSAAGYGWTSTGLVGCALALGGLAIWAVSWKVGDR